MSRSSSRSALPRSRSTEVCSSRAAGSATLSCHSMLSSTSTPPERSSRMPWLDVLGVLHLVGVDDDHVVGAVGHPREHVERPAGDDPGALVGDARLGVGLLGHALVLGLDVDRGEDAVLGHALEHPQPRRAGAGADLDDRLGLHRCREQAQQHPRTVADRGGPQLLAAAPRRLDHLVLGDELLGVGPAGRLLCAHAANPTAAAGPARAHGSGPRGIQGTLRLVGNDASRSVVWTE